MKIKRFTSGRDFPTLKLYIFTLFGQDTCILKRDLITKIYQIYYSYYLKLIKN